jgi:hypothetical protein
VIARLIAGYQTIARRIAARWTWFRVGLKGIFIGPPKFFRIATEFFTEAAVLVAVFPILDTIIEPLGGVQKVSWHLVEWSEGIAAALLFLAGIMSMAVKE